MTRHDSRSVNFVIQLVMHNNYICTDNAEVPRRVETCTILYDGEEILLPTKPNASSGAMVDLNGMVSKCVKHIAPN